MNGGGAPPLTSRLVAKGRAMPAAVGSALQPLLILNPSAAVDSPEPRTPPRARRVEPNAGRRIDAGAGRVRLTLRLDPERHLKLRLVAAHLRRTVQAVLTAAIDLHLEEVVTRFEEGCTCLERGTGLGLDCPPDGCARHPLPR